MIKQLKDRGVYLLAAVLLLLASGVIAEERYRDLLFDDVDVVTGVQFGVGRREGAADQLLLMDIYTPAGDTATNRAAVVLAFPGGFVDGARNDPEMVAMATRFARHGFVAASIDYRLIEGNPDSSGELEVRVLESVHDMRAAVRFFRADAAQANVYGTDGVHVFAGGISAGAVMAAAMGTLDASDELGNTATQFLATSGGIAGNSSANTEFSSAVSGVLQISGAIRDVAWIEPDSAPIYAAHEEFDPIVPCGTIAGLGFASFGLLLESSGACDMIPAAQDVGVSTDFFFDSGSFDHVGFSNSEFLQILDESAQFFFNEVLRPVVLASAVLPGSRAVQVDEVATVFATVINAADMPLTGCTVVPMTDVPADFSYQTASVANDVLGEPNTPFTMAPGAVQNLVLSITPDDGFSSTELFLRYECDDARAAPNALGLNTVLLSASDDPVADVVGLTTEVDLVADVNATALFAVGSANVGVQETITVSLDDGGVGLPLDLMLCRTDSQSGACLETVSASSTLTYEGGSTASFAVFATPQAPIAFNPAINRIFVRFETADGLVRGSTSTAVRTR